MTHSSDEPRMLGDYQLREKVLETPLALRWLAEQVSVGRKVQVDVLKPELLDQRGPFIADVRAKAAMKHPIVASVFEAITEDDHCYYAHEFLPGRVLSVRIEAREPMKPFDLAYLLRRIAEVQAQLEAQRQSSAPLNLQNIRIDDHGVLRMDNLARGGLRADGETARDMIYLGQVLPPLVADGQPGTTRLLTLLSWMRGEEVESPMQWFQVIELCEQIEKQLSEPFVTRQRTSEDEGGSSHKPKALIWMAGVLAIAVVLISVIRMRSGEEGVSMDLVPLPGPLTIPECVISGTAVPTFHMMAHEVTIGEYERFLGVLKALAGTEQASVYDHKDQPAEKTSHVPDDWAALLAAAKSASAWNGQRLNLTTPVVGVDWWDAAAYAEWKHGNLPSYSQWLAALGMDPEKVSQIHCARWGPINLKSVDRSGCGALNMAGSVSEWLLDPAASPSNPLGEKKWVLMGGSYLQHGSHAMSREWIDDRNLRRKDVGFRLVFDSK